MYTSVVKPRADRIVGRLTRFQQEKIGTTLEKLRQDPYKNSLNIRKLKGTTGHFFRIRIGDLRIIYEIAEEKKLITVHIVDFRGNVY